MLQNKSKNESMDNREKKGDQICQRTNVHMDLYTNNSVALTRINYEYNIKLKWRNLIRKKKCCHMNKQHPFNKKSPLINMFSLFDFDYFLSSNPDIQVMSQQLPRVIF